MRAWTLLSLGLLAGCGPRVAFDKAAFAQLKTVAVVQYAVYAGEVPGADELPQVQVRVADTNLGNLLLWLKDLGFTFLSLDEVKKNAVYLAQPGDPPGFKGATGLRQPAALRPGRPLELASDTAAALCQALGVDAVLVASETWRDKHSGGLRHGRVRFKTELYVQVLDRTGQQVWGDHADELSAASSAAVFFTSFSAEGLFAEATSSVVASLEVIRGRLAGALGR